MSTKSLATRAVGLAFAFTAFGAAAQQPNPMDNVPDKMPFDVPYGVPVSLDRAQAAIAAAVAESRGTGSQDEVACKAGAETVK